MGLKGQVEGKSQLCCQEGSRSRAAVTDVGKTLSRDCFLTHDSLHSQVRGVQAPSPSSERVGLQWALLDPPCRLCSLSWDAVGDSFSQPLSCPGNRPGLCDLPKGENSSCRRPLPWISGHRARLLDESPRRPRLQGSEDGLPSLEEPLRCLSTQGPPRQPLGLLVGRDRRAPV